MAGGKHRLRLSKYVGQTAIPLTLHRHSNYVSAITAQMMNVDLVVMRGCNANHIHRGELTAKFSTEVTIKTSQDLRNY